MGWNIEEPKKKEDKTLKLLGIFMIILFLIIVAILVSLYALKVTTFVLKVDGENKKYSDKLIQEQNGIKYINIKELAGILGYSYHMGEYKEFSQNDDKCYIESTQETASFFLNSNKICKIGIENKSEDYKIFECNFNTIKINNEFYAPLDTIKTAFNISAELNDKKMEILTLTNIINVVEKKVNPDEKNPMYNSLLEEDFENQKALLYGYVISCKKDNNLYSVRNITNLGEIVSDKYKKIDFIEETKEFIVTNINDKVGIIDKNGQNKVEQIYDSIKVINANPKFYLVENDKKYGVIDKDGNSVVYTEYDKIGIDNTKFTNIKNQYILLNKVIPVEKDNKCGLFSLDGEKILDVNYKGFGCEDKTIKTEDSEKTVVPVIEIEECNGIVVKNGENYDLYLIDTKQIVSLKVTNIYSIIENGKINYYMIYKEKELNLIENLIKLGYIKENQVEDDENKSETNQVGVNNNVSNTITNNKSVNTTNNMNTDNTNNSQVLVTNQMITPVNSTENR